MNPAVAAPRQDTRRCRVCGATGAVERYTLNESMFETWEPFDYFLCGSCECLQIDSIPNDMRRHYRTHYYSFSSRKAGWLRKKLKASTLRNVSGKGSIVGAILSALGAKLVDADWIRRTGINCNSRILDVGCGNGERLHDLWRGGFRHLLGVDAFIERDVLTDGRVLVRKAELAEITGEFDLIMFHHSLEHLPDPRGAIQQAARLIAANGQILVRIPVFGKWAWQHYGTDWVQLDPPRHLYTFSEKGVGELAKSASLKVVRVIYDSTNFQFEGSERIRRLRRKKLGESQIATDVMTRQKMKLRVRELNAAGQGDQACFYLVSGEQ